MARSPMEKSNKRVIRDLYYLRLFDGFELSVADKIIASDFYNDSHPEWERGPEGIKAVVRMLHAALSDLHMEIHLLIAEGPYVFAYTTQTGIHDRGGYLMGKEPDGTRFAQVQGHLFKFDERGQIKQHDVIRDDKVTAVNVEGKMK